MNSLSAYRGQFKSIVLAHVTEMLSVDEWNRLRFLSVIRKGPRDPFSDGQDLRLFLTDSPEVLFDRGCTQDSMTVQETLDPASFKATQIGQINGSPVFYVEGRGIYCWGQHHCSRPTLSFWLTFPAYPPGW